LLFSTGASVVAIVTVAGIVVVRGPSPGDGALDAAAGRDAAEMVELQFSPADSAVDVPLDSSITVHITAGHLDLVTATGALGAPVEGTTDADGTTWRFDGPLAPGTTYSVIADGTTPAGEPIHGAATFTTVTPSDVLTPRITPSDGLIVGVGQPIVVRFDSPVTDQQAMLRRLTVTMSAPVPGAWHWFTETEVHFRPKDYWPAGEHVTVTVDLAGYDNGDGVWGDGVHTSEFTVGDSHISTVDLEAHTMTVTDNGQVERTMPVSAGRDKYPTMTGTHIALYRQRDVLMDSSTVGIPRNSPDGYYEHVYWDVAITDGGEFVHAAPWSASAQGNRNVSHGCVNLSEADAEWFFNFSRMGDVIDVVNGPRPPELADHGVMDWNTPWEVWLAGASPDRPSVR